MRGCGLCPQVGVVGGHAAQGQVVWGEDGRPLCFGKRQNPDQRGRACSLGASLGSRYRPHGDPGPQSPWGDRQARPASFLAVGGLSVSGPVLSLHTGLHWQGQGLVRKNGLQCSEGQDPGSARDALGGRWQQRSVTEAQAGGRSSEARVGGHYTKASRLDEPLTLRYSLLSSLFCCSCLSSWRR